jgi:hypothetical protein
VTQQHVVTVLGRFDLDEAGTPQPTPARSGQVEHRLQQVQPVPCTNCDASGGWLHRQVSTPDGVTPQFTALEATSRMST